VRVRELALCNLKTLWRCSHEWAQLGCEECHRVAAFNETEHNWQDSEGWQRQWCMQTHTICGCCLIDRHCVCYGIVDVLCGAMRHSVVLCSAMGHCSGTMWCYEAWRRPLHRLCQDLEQHLSMMSHWQLYMWGQHYDAKHFLLMWG